MSVASVTNMRYAPINLSECVRFYDSKQSLIVKLWHVPIIKNDRMFWEQRIICLSEWPVKSISILHNVIMSRPISVSFLIRTSGISQALSTRYRSILSSIELMSHGNMLLSHGNMLMSHGNILRYFSNYFPLFITSLIYSKGPASYKLD